MVWESMLWYYVSSRQERLSVPEDQMRALAGSGVLRPTTLVWHKGMEDWVSAGELKPELFVPVVGGGTAEGVAEADTGLVTELARTLRTYAGWVEVSGWLHGATGAACVAVGTAIGYFAWLRPERLADWAGRVPPSLEVLLKHPWWTAGALWLAAVLLFLMGGQLIGAAARARRAEQLRSREELRIALRGVGGFFRVTVISLLVGLLLLAFAVLHYFRPAQNPPEPATPAEPAVERVTI